jgi:hypothetical protein
VAFTYDPTTLTGLVRLLIADTVATEGPLPGGANLSDEEISALSTGAPYGTASKAAGVIAAAWASKVTVRAGPLRRDFEAAAIAWERRAKALLEEGARQGEAIAITPPLTSSTIEAGQTEPPDMGGYSW